MAKEKITLDNLARMVKKGFDDLSDSVHSRFDQVDQRFNAVDERLTDLENGQEQIQNMFYSQIERIDGHEKRIKYLESSKS